jgi:4-diphosphocytidyl-2C-methyl-D-erythritol kinase
LGESISLPDWKLLLIKPPFPVSSAEVYTRLQATGYRLQDDTTLLNGISIFNDLAIPVFEKYLQLPILKSWLQARSEVAAAWMTGSGSTLVAALQKECSAEKILDLQKNIAAEFGKTFWIKETCLCSRSLQPVACSP